ncbi:hypothetical protein HpBTM60_18020 [Helicobacter pylori]
MMNAINATNTDPSIASIPQTAINNKNIMTAVNKLFKIAFRCNNMPQDFLSKRYQQCIFKF